MSLLLFLIIVTVVVYALIRYGDAYRAFKDAYADEWFAYYQYWLATQSTTLSEAAKKEFTEHANDELRHASMLAQYLIAHGEKPPQSPMAWYRSMVVGGCGYKRPDFTNARSMIQDALNGELCAIDGYAKMINESPPDATVMLQEILKDEREHADDLRKLL